MDPRRLRATLAADPDLGTGNVLDVLARHGADPAGPGVAFDTPVDDRPAGHPMSLGELSRRVAARAAALHAWGIGPRDPVAIYVTAAADCLLTFLALCRLGAIPALLNGNLPGDVAAEFLRRLRATGIVVDAHHRGLLDGRDLGAPILAEAADLGHGDPAQAPEHYRHHADDPVAITHSSGTTRMPAAVVHSHASLFAAIRPVYLSEARQRGGVRMLSVLPPAHAAGIIALNQALCNRQEALFLSAQGGAAGAAGRNVLDAIERWRPTRVLGFAATWAELAHVDLSGRDLSSVQMWFNTGDCAHEAHIRPLVAAGSRPAFTREGPGTVPGSCFLDGLGSTETGHSVFAISHRPDTSRYGRCVGKPYPFVQVALLDLATGDEVPVGAVGHVGLRSPTLAPGYWNDSVATYRSRYRGWYLTGDLMYRDEDGYYYHVDRAVDAIDLGDGRWIYTALTEERILAACPGVVDCTVVAGRDGGEVMVDVLLTLRPTAPAEADWPAVVRSAVGSPVAEALRRVSVVPQGDIVFGPTGKVRKFLMRQRLAAGATTVAGQA